MGKDLRLLVIEDSEDDTRLLLRELSRLGYQVDFQRVETAEEMRSALAQQAWDLILSDYSLPQFSAPRALEVLQVSGLDLPFIIVSGTIGEETAVTALKAGADDFLVKGKFARLGPAIERGLREAALRQERARAQHQIDYHARLLRHVNDAVIATDSEFRITAWNRAAERIYGWSAAEVLGRSVDDVLKSGLNPEQQEEARQLLKEQSSRRSERMHARKNGRVIYVEENTIALSDESGQVTGYVSVNRDVTERKQAEEALRENERLLSEAQRIGHVGSWSYNIVTDTLQFSDEMYRLLDVSPREFPHTWKGFLEVIYPSDKPLAARWMENIGNGKETKELNFRLFRKNGELRYILCRGAVVFNSSGQPVRFTGMAQDITERKLAEIQIRQQLDRLSALRKIDQAIASNLDLRVTLGTLLSEVRTQLQVDAADVLLLDPAGQMLEYAAGQGFRTSAIETARVPIGKRYAGQVAQERRLIRAENLKQHSGDPLVSGIFAGEDFVSYYGVPLIAKGNIKGVLEVFHRGPVHPYPEWLDFLNILAGQTAIAIDNTSLFENLQASNRELLRAYDTTIEGWSRALDLRDKETEGHTLRVTEMMLKLAQAFGLPQEEMQYIRWGCLLHDIGKMGVPDHILLKAGPLTEEEWVQMKTHPEYAYELLRPIPFLARALDIPHCHHERWDGAGYPRGLQGEEIPLAARLFAVIDVWDALTSNRPYRLAWSECEALAYVREESGKQFDPRVVEAFLQLLAEKKFG